MSTLKLENYKSDHLPVIKRVIGEELKGLELLHNNPPLVLDEVVEAIINMQGRLIVSGMGKSGHIAKKIAASFSSTGTAALYIHPGEASHGDLGMITEQDVVLLMSNSGETHELYDIINYCKRFKIPIIAMTMKPSSTLATAADYAIIIPKSAEASIVDAPTTSALMMLCIGDALMVAVHEAKGFTKEHYKLFHPGGKIGKNLLKVADLMHKEPSLPTVNVDSPMSDILLTMTGKGFGCAAVLDGENKLVGVITDGDLRRHMNEDIIRLTASSVMTATPKDISPQAFATEALAIMNSDGITSLLVTEQDKLVGIIHIHDLLRVGIS
ncbi:MAG: kdsD [Rickettsiaceae bacterium]|jgi:arabinose-5-phosphate isomerase|nr:kdsD [Rickettsiaceae bacterium]